MRGIMFIEELFHKTVSGQKTETRRIIPADANIEKVIPAENGKFAIVNRKTGVVRRTVRPTYKKDSVVFLKEPYALFEQDNGPDDVRYKFDYTHNSIHPMLRTGWKNKMFMPGEAARYYIRCTGVKVQQLSDMTAADALAEGIDPDYIRPDMEFINLWDSINKKQPYTADNDPFVFVYQYEFLEFKCKEGDLFYFKKEDGTIHWDDKKKFLDTLPF